jgi:hypothetical protein
VDEIMKLLGERYVQGFLLAALGIIIGWLLGRWRRHQLKRQVAGGDLRDLIAIEQILVKVQLDARPTLRIRSCGSAALEQVLTNLIAREAFLKRAAATTPANPLISMHDKIGSFLLHLLQPWVCSATRQGPFPHDIWVMAPVCEPSILSEFQTTTVVLVRQADLKRFLDWDECKRIQAEHSSDGARILTLWHMAREFEKQLAEVQRRRAAGEPSAYAETMYILDLALDVEEASLPTRPIPWQRFEKTLKELGLNA